MPASDARGGTGLNDLIRDIGQSDGRRNSLETAEQQLMRLASDPLKLGAFLARREGDGCSPDSRVAVPGEVTIALARCILAQGSLERAGRMAGVGRYEGEEPRRPSFLSPTIFEPSRSDREGALDHVVASPPGSARDHKGRVAGAVVAALGCLLVTVLLALTIVPN